MKTIYKQRLLKLAAFLRKVPRKHFDLQVITNVETTDIYGWNLTLDKILVQIDSLRKVGKKCKRLNCKTAACAVGWCPSVFPRVFKWNDNGSVVSVKDENEYDFLVAERFFCLAEYSSTYLFRPESYRPGHRGPKSVAGRIEKLVKNNGMIPRYKDYIL